MKIFFETKEESNQRRLKEFLSLTPAERFERFLWLSRHSMELFGKKNSIKKDNFVIKKKRGKRIILL